MYLNLSAFKLLIQALPLLIFVATLRAQTPESLTRDIDQIFIDVVLNGKVDYARVVDKRGDLDRIVAQLDGLNVQEDDTRTKSFWINAYNFLVIYSIATAYPIKSPKDIPGFYDGQTFRIGSKDFTLNAIEKEVLFTHFPDARLHFALVCGATSCPPLSGRAYESEVLDVMLDEQAIKALNDSNFIRIEHSDKSILVSQIFEWYEPDFILESQSVREFINRFRTVRLPEDYSLGYYDYDWSLNYINRDSDEVELQTISLQSRTPSTMLPESTIELKVFNNIYTQTAWFTTDGEKQNLANRESYYTSTIGAYYGWSDDLDIGLDIYIKSTRVDGAESSPLSILGFSGAEKQETSLTALAPKLKFALSSLVGKDNGFDKFAVQTTLLLPLAQNLENKGGLFVDYSSPQLWTQLFADFSLATNTLAYVELGAILRFDDDGTVVNSPLKAFLNYYPSAAWTIYVPMEINPRWRGNGSDLWASWYVQTGLGLKYALLHYWELELLYTSFIAGKAAGAGQTFNIGSRILL